MNIILLGPQGSGKGTQAELLSKKYALYYFESGRFLRQLAKEDQRVDEIVNRIGALIPNQEMLQYVKDDLQKHVPSLTNMLLEGFPRDVEQYNEISQWLKEKGSEIDLAIVLEIPEEETIRRLSSRRTCDVCGEIYNLITNPPPHAERCKCGGRLVQREDDTPDAIKKRLEIYHNQTQPLVDILNNQGILIKINATKTIEDVFNDILQNINKYEGKN